MEKKLQVILTKAIPLTKAMGITVEKYDGMQLTILAPLANNFNHLGTAFGVSLCISHVCFRAGGCFSCDCARKV